MGFLGVPMMRPRCGTEDTSEDGGRQRVVPSYGTGWTRPPIPGTYVPGFHMAPLRPSGLLMEYPGNRARARPKSSGPACLLRDVKIADQCLVRDVKIPALFLQRTENKDGGREVLSARREWTDKNQDQPRRTGMSVLPIRLHEDFAG